MIIIDEQYGKKSKGGDFFEWLKNSETRSKGEMKTILVERYVEVEVKSCPFCGGWPSIEFHDRRTKSKGYKAHCNNCNLVVEMPEWTFEEALEFWNTRKGDK